MIASSIAGNGRLFTEGAGVVAIAAVCLLIALAMPIMEVIPFSANGAEIALTAFGLALISKDGVLALFPLSITLATMGLIGYHLFFLPRHVLSGRIRLLGALHGFSGLLYVLFIGNRWPLLVDSVWLKLQIE